MYAIGRNELFVVSFLHRLGTEYPGNRAYGEILSTAYE